MSGIVALATVSAVLVISAIVAGRMRHPELKPVEAVLIFTAVFAVAGAVFFTVSVWAIQLFGPSQLSGVLGAVAAALGGLVPASLLGVWAVRQKPEQAPKID